MNMLPSINFMPFGGKADNGLEYFVERQNPVRDLGGVCECFVSDTLGLQNVAIAHVHQHFELLYCLKGGYELAVQRQRFTLREGDVALIHPMEPHQTRTLTQGENSYLVLKFTPEALYSASQPLYELKYIFPYIHLSAQRSYVYTRERLEGSVMDKLLRLILEERESERYGYEMAVRAYVSQVLLWFIRAWHDQSDMADIDERTLARLRDALGYISEHLGETLSVEMVATHLGMGASTFSRFFAKACGSAFPAYVRAARLSRVVERLVGSDASITEIAVETGFSTASYLIVCFRARYKMTPRQFRDLYAPKRQNIAI